ncbi:MAG: flagellar basal body-associated protein FliL [Burkholderiales bacterium]|jgi:flagellar FliL protein|nr:flagellar basal body-associated protein FliL [Burkholderiales bacterium]
MSAQPAAAPAEGGDEDAAKKKKKKMMIIIIAAVVLLGGGGGGAFFMMKKKKPKKPPVEVAEEEPVEEPVKKGPPAFTIMDPFVVNISDGEEKRYLQIGITYQVVDAKASDNMKAYIPILRSRILLILASKDVKALSTVNGKQALMDELLDMARDTVQYKGKDRGIVDVHFSSFVIQ